MGNVFYFEWEITLMEWLQGHSNKLMEILAWFFTQFGEEMVLVGLLGFLYWGVNKEFGKRLGRDMLVLFLSAPMLKNIAMRRRLGTVHSPLFSGSCRIDPVGIRLNTECRQHKFT